MHTRLASLAAATLLLSTACGRSPTPAATKEAWDEVNDPLRLGTDYERNFKMLPLAGALDKTPWSDTYWPSYMGGVAYRWNGTPSEGFAYTAPNAATVAKMTPEELAALSPAEKFDIARGKMDYPLLASERARTRPSSPSWEGICHGWAPAALLYDEPKAVLVDGPGGLKIPFGSADIKALLDLYVGNNAWTRSPMLGSRCSVDLDHVPDAANRPECRDVNAGAFHVIITNFLGLRKKGFVADVTRDAEVWNQPVHGFSSRIVRDSLPPSPGAAPGTVAEMDIETRMTYSIEIAPSWAPVVGTSHQSNRNVIYRYRVELNAAGGIIGGEWLSNERPDFLWTQGMPLFEGEFQLLGKIYGKATDPATVSLPMPRTTPQPMPQPATPSSRT